MKNFNGTPKVYLAGPDVFLKDGKEYLEGLQKICKAHGLRGLSPLDVSLDNPEEIFHSNLNLIKSADYVVANISPWRGPSCDVGTAFEMGFAHALGRPIFAHTIDCREYKHKCASGCGLQTFPHEGKMVDPYGFLIEDFCLQDNLMVAVPVHSIASSFRHAIDNLMEYLS